MLHMRARALLHALTRKKPYGLENRDPSGENGTTKPGSNDPGGNDPAKLARVLGLADLTLLGIGATLGVGVYVLAGSVAKNQAGPAVLVSLVLAAVASLFSGLCYVEFASRVSQAGSAYTYTYLSIGEFLAFVIGWNLVLEYIIGTASEAKAISNQLDALLGNVYETRMTSLLPIRCAFLADYPDFIAAAITLTMTGLISYGVAESTRLNSVFTFLNLGTVLAIVLSGLGHLNPANWSIRRADIPAAYRPNAGAGGFAPFGVNGIIVGAAKCFFGFIGFDCIATTGEESRNPRRNIPLSILLSLLVVFLCFFSIALVLTLILPYYQQDADAPFPHIFDALGMPLMKWVVTVGSLFALLTGMFGALFPLPRILYAMSEDGLLYPSFAYVSPLTRTPVVSSLLAGLLTALLSAIFKLDQLVDMLSIGTLLAYTIVALSVLILRYSVEARVEENHSADCRGDATSCRDDYDTCERVEYISSKETCNKDDHLNQTSCHKTSIKYANIKMGVLKMNGDCHSDSASNENPGKMNGDCHRSLRIENDAPLSNPGDGTHATSRMSKHACEKNKSSRDKPDLSRYPSRVMHDDNTATLVNVKTLQTEFSEGMRPRQTEFDQGYSSLDRAIPLDNQVVDNEVIEHASENQMIDQVIKTQVFDNANILSENNERSEIGELIDKVLNDAIRLSIERVGEEEEKGHVEISGDIADLSQNSGTLHHRETDGSSEGVGDTASQDKIQHAPSVNENQTNTIGPDKSSQSCSKGVTISTEPSNKLIDNVNASEHTYSVQPTQLNATKSYTRREDSTPLDYEHTGTSSSQVHLCEDSLEESRNNFARTFNILFNVNSTHAAVTPASQRLSKICISLFILLTILVCLILNSVFSVNLELDSTYVGPMNATLALSTASHRYHLRDRNTTRAHSRGATENDVFLLTGPNRTLHSLPREQQKAARSSDTLADCVTEALVAIASKMAAWGATTPRSVASSPTTEHSVAVTSHVSGVNLSASSYRRVAEDILDSPLTSGWELVKGCVYVAVGVAYCLVFLVLARQNQDPARPSFSVPLVPLVPCLSIFMNIYLMLNLDVSTWVRFLVWMVLGLGVYFTYGLQHSKLSKLKTV